MIATIEQAPTSASQLIKAQSASYPLSLAIQGPFLLAIIGAAVVLRRPGMRAYAVIYTLLSVASICSALSLTLLVDGPTFASNVFLAGSMMCIAAYWSANRHAVAALAGHTSERWPRVPHMLVSGVVATVVVLALPRLPVGGIAAALLARWAPRPLILFFVTSSAILAWRTSRTATQNAIALRLVSVSFAALALRQLYGIAVALQVTAGGDSSQQSLVFVQAMTAVLNGVALLAALMFEERTAIEAQAEQMRQTSARLARTERLESLGQMAGGIAHDFANVLTAIRGGITLARNDAPSDVAMELQEVEASVDRAAELTRQLMLFARQQPLAPQVFRADDRVQAIAPMLKRLLGSGVTLETTASSAVDVAIEMDPSQFDQVLLNLVVNARDAMPAGGCISVLVDRVVVGPSGEVRDAARVSDGPVMRLRVEDTGHGIHADQLDQVFEPFFTTKGDRGTGLGLATVQSVVRQARGDIAVTSREGRGTRFEVRIPAVD